MSKNVITINIDSERDKPILITKPQDMQPDGEGKYEDMIKKDVHDMILTSIYMGSMVSEEDELKLLNKSEEMIKKRLDEVNRNNKEES